MRVILPHFVHLSLHNPEINFLVTEIHLSLHFFYENKALFIIFGLHHTSTPSNHRVTSLFTGVWCGVVKDLYGGAGDGGTGGVAAVSVAARGGEAGVERISMSMSGAFLEMVFVVLVALYTCVDHVNARSHSCSLDNC